MQTVIVSGYDSYSLSAAVDKRSLKQLSFECGPSMIGLAG